MCVSFKVFTLPRAKDTRTPGALRSRIAHPPRERARAFAVRLFRLRLRERTAGRIPHSDDDIYLSMKMRRRWRASDRARAALLARLHHTTATIRAVRALVEVSCVTLHKSFVSGSARVCSPPKTTQTAINQIRKQR